MFLKFSFMDEEKSRYLNQFEEEKIETYITKELDKLFGISGTYKTQFHDYYYLEDCDRTGWYELTIEVDDYLKKVFKDVAKMREKFYEIPRQITFKFQPIKDDFDGYVKGVDCEYDFDKYSCEDDLKSCFDDEKEVTDEDKETIRKIVDSLQDLVDKIEKIITDIDGKVYGEGGYTLK